MDGQKWDEALDPTMFPTSRSWCEMGDRAWFLFWYVGFINLINTKLIEIRSKYTTDVR